GSAGSVSRPSSSAPVGLARRFPIRLAECGSANVARVSSALALLPLRPGASREEACRVPPEEREQRLLESPSLLRVSGPADLECDPYLLAGRYVDETRHGVSSSSMRLGDWRASSAATGLSRHGFRRTAL